MKQLKKLCPIAVTLLTLGLSGCGSDSDNIVDMPDSPDASTPPIEERNPAWEFIETPYFELKDTKLKGEVEVVLGRRVPTSETWMFEGITKFYAEGDASADLNGDGQVNRYDVTVAGIRDEDIGPVFKVQTSDMAAYLATNPDGLGAGTARPDIFVEGQYSVFDLLRYLVGTRDDLRFEGAITSFKDSKYDTYEFNLSWDFNGDGKFNKDDGEHYNSPLWHFGFRHPNGGYPTEQYNFAGTGHVHNWKRMDHFWLRESDSLRFLTHSEAMTNRRHWIWQQEQNRLAENDGKFIVPLVTRVGDQSNSIYQGQTHVIAENLEVIPFNLRSDVYQPGVITSIDVWLTLAKYHGLDFRFIWWPTIVTGAKVNSFGISRVPWIGDFDNFSGVTPYQGEIEAATDFIVGPLPQCNFTKEGVPTEPGQGEIDQATCYKEFVSSPGGNFVPEPFGSNILSYPPEYMTLFSHTFTFPDLENIDLKNDPKVEMYVAKDELQFMNLNAAGDFDLYPTEDVTGVASLVYFPAADEESKVGNAPILDETHFGWKIADCTQCHNAEKDPLGHGGQSWPINKADGFDIEQPYYCASCHGSNGAPKAHNRSAACYWCHNTHNGEGLLPKNHGNVSKPKFIPAEKIVANQRQTFNIPIGGDGQIRLYDDMWAPSPNSNYTLSKTFPDPFACGTCHNPQ